MESLLPSAIHSQGWDLTCHLPSGLNNWTFPASCHQPSIIGPFLLSAVQGQKWDLSHHLPSSLQNAMVMNELFLFKFQIMELPKLTYTLTCNRPTVPGLLHLTTHHIHINMPRYLLYLEYLLLIPTSSHYNVTLIQPNTATTGRHITGKSKKCLVTSFWWIITYCYIVKN